ncbi:MAG: ATP synthase F0 subunit B [Pyrinomonadaceae bacterium]|nr:ATP synthase F0 subunit B [Pyrinomonadaceae bacterium]MCX7639624.1 ATP synthase F0 subunit B [Pyrinomonadaceae bacterium]MDW8303358.1 ATP synthase F0 subunit B [Acidobacteriota bacterium]
MYELFLIAANKASGGFLKWWYDNVDPIVNYPGFELWRFFNLTIFLILVIYFLRKPLSESFKAKREQIRLELIAAREEKQKAEAHLAEVKKRLSNLEEEKQKILEEAKKEAEAEKQRIIEAANLEIEKIREQAENEIERLIKQTRQELKKISAEETIRLAKELVKQKLTPELHTKLIKNNIDSIGGLN